MMNPVFLELGGFSLKWYTLFVLIAVIIGLYLVCRETKRFGIKNDFILNLAFYVIIFGLIGARLYYVIFKWDYYSNNLLEVLQIWQGGIAIHGAIIGGIITIFVYCRKYNVRLIRYLDFVLIPLLLSQAIGRWGNFFNSEAYGGETTVQALQSLLVPKVVIEGMYIDGAYRFPAFWFEFLACLTLFLVFLFIRRGKYTKVGTMTGLYLMGYGVVRFFIEINRFDALMIMGYKMAQLVSVVMFLIGLVIIMINMRKSKFEDLYNDKNNIDTLRF